MANCTVKDSQEEIRSNPNPTSTSGSSEYHTATQDASTTNPMSSSSSVYYSARIDSMIENRCKFSSEVEFEVESSKVHWSELDPMSFDSGIEYSAGSDRQHWKDTFDFPNLASGNGSRWFRSQPWAADFKLDPMSLDFDSNSDSDSDSDIEHSAESDLQHFKMLKKRWGGFFKEFDLVVGKKIAEGAQAEIYEAELKNGENSGFSFVVKVFNEGFPLRSLQSQWPLGMLSAHNNIDYRTMPLGMSSAYDCYDNNNYRTSLQEKVFDVVLSSNDDDFFKLLMDYKRFFHVEGGTLLKDERLKNRFAFVMKRQWGDLRKLIDLVMLHNNNQGAPFPIGRVKDLMLYIAENMYFLHRRINIIHRDLKASNVLIWGPSPGQTPEIREFWAVVADYECSVGVMGTGFWRAPEILQQLKHRVSSSKLKFTRKADVYSYAMTCYEIVTGRIPFEGHLMQDYDLVLSGQRPELPHDLDPLVKQMITSCWHPDPLHRPSFDEIYNSQLRWPS